MRKLTFFALIILLGFSPRVLVGVKNTKESLPSSVNKELFDFHSKTKVFQNPENQDNLIPWSEDRKLRIEDFKAIPKKGKFIALTSSSISFEAHGSKETKKGTVIIKTFFDCDKSYFKVGADSTETLAHEQIHFDITEVYARIFLKKLNEKTSNYQEFIKKHKAIYETVFKEMSAKQNEYDKEVYPDPSKQEKWSNWVSKQLKDLSQYSVKEMVY
ncbi:MAG: hypothetical protein K9I36_14405 [Bacteroidia bacterium]|nr:hypothetical protein [Bacteroidia bacterium]